MEIVPEQKRWWTLDYVLQRLRMRRREERSADRDADTFIGEMKDLSNPDVLLVPKGGKHRKPAPTAANLRISPDDLRSTLAAPATRYMAGSMGKPPWHIASIPPPAPRPAGPETPGADQEPEPRAAPEPPKTYVRNPPTVVMEVVRPAIERDLKKYLEGLPGYEED